MKKLMGVLIIMAAIAYSLLVYSWIVEGNANFDQQRNDSNNLNGVTK